MTAMDLITLRDDLQPHPGRPKVSSGSTLYEILPRMAESADCTVDVTRDGLTVGCIDAPAAVRALSETFTRSDEASVLTVECAREDYSASLLAHAVEDVDAHLLNLSVMPADGGRLNVSLRIGHRDPQAAIHSLERYGFNVTEAYPGPDASPTALDKRLAALQVFLNV